MAMDLKRGRIVHIRSKGSNGDERCQAAMVVQVWDSRMINAVVFRDGLNDSRYDNNPTSDTTRWATSVPEDASAAKPSTFHDPRECPHEE